MSESSLAKKKAPPPWGFSRKSPVPEDNVQEIEGLSLEKIARLCSNSVFNKAKRYNTKNSAIFRTQSSALRNCITGQFKAARIHEQNITWGDSSAHIQEIQPFTLTTIKVYCSCKYFVKETSQSGLCCSHIIGQLRRVCYLTSIN